MDTQVGFGSLGKNRHQTAANQPGLKGKLTFEQPIAAGTTVWLSGWRKEPTDGSDPYISLSVSVSDGQPRYPQQGQRPQQGGYQRQAPQRQAPQRQPQAGGFSDDEIPF